MSGKSRHGRRKLSRSKRRKGGQAAPTISAQQPVVAQSYKPVSHPEASPPSAGVPATVAALAGTRYPYIVGEMKRIGILTGIILLILVILALVFS